LFAQGDKSKVTVQLEQHAIQPNVYFAPLSLPPDTYRLKTINEYRSYFWETPIYHKYRPFEYASHNNLTVYKPQTVAGSKLMLPVCDIKNKTAPLLQGAWIESSHYEQLEPSNFYRMFENSQDDFMVDDRVFVPEQCRLDYISAGAGARCLGQKKVHVWGDVNIKR
jgi:hypothetical protein